MSRLVSTNSRSVIQLVSLRQILGYAAPPGPGEEAIERRQSIIALAHVFSQSFPDVSRNALAGLCCLDADPSSDLLFEGNGDVLHNRPHKISVALISCLTNVVSSVRRFAGLFRLDETLGVHGEMHLVLECRVLAAHEQFGVLGDDVAQRLDPRPLALGEIAEHVAVD